jgi:uncharacterized protein
MKTLFSSIFLTLSLIVTASAQMLDTPINVIQGDGDISPRDKATISTRGIVTAVIKKGFYIQTPDADIDKSSKTSEGVFVFTKEAPPAEAVVGNLVQVSGIIAEYKPSTDKYSLTLTQITRPRVQLISKENPLPAPFVLTAVDIDPKGAINQMERFEGMRVKINSLIACSGTGGRIDEKSGIAFPDGSFFGVLKGIRRPMKESGLDVLRAIVDKLPMTFPVFDMNPEMLRIDSNEQIGTKPIHVSADATVKNLTGVVDYVYKTYTIFVDSNSSPVVENIKEAAPGNPAKPREVLVSSFNLENFFDDEKNSENVEEETISPKAVFEGRLNKASMTIRNYMMLPDVIGLIEVENLKVLKKLADKVNADAIAAKQVNPEYEAYLEEGNDGRGIDVGFLIRKTRVNVVEIKQIGKDAVFTGPDKKTDPLFDRPSFLAKLDYPDAVTGKPFEFTVVINHLKSYSGIDDPKTGERTRLKKRLQAEWLANFVAERAKTNPTERLIMCGDFNAFQFNDGYNDVIGILKGKPDVNALEPSKTAVNTGLINLVDLIPTNQRYSFIFAGNAQTLDHVLVNEAAAMRSLSFGFVRVNADFPLKYYNDASRPERLSDHDPAMLYLSLDEIKVPKTDETKPKATPTPKP